MSSKKEKGLSVNDIDKRFADVEALVDVSLDVHEGEFYTLLGPSGCGKTTLLRIIAGLELPDTGQVILGGQDITSLPATKRQVNTVFQSYALFPHLNIFENVAFGLRSRKYSQDEVKSRVNRRLEMLGLQEMAERFPHQLSGGQQQRLCIARALATKPNILLMDEPCSALDPIATGKIEDLIDKLQSDYTIVIVTHNLQQAARISDYTGFLYLGKLVEFGETKKLFTNPKEKLTENYITGRFG